MRTERTQAGKGLHLHHVVLQMWFLEDVHLRSNPMDSLQEDSVEVSPRGIVNFSDEADLETQHVRVGWKKPRRALCPSVTSCSMLLPKPQQLCRARL